MKPALLSSVFLAISVEAGPTRAPPNEYILAPCTRTLRAATVHSTQGTVIDAGSLVHQDGYAQFNGLASVTLDIGKNVAGSVSFSASSALQDDATIAVTFSESSLWILSNASDASVDNWFDDPLHFAVGTQSAFYQADGQHSRGAFRYLTMTSNTTHSIRVGNVSVHFEADPDREPCDYAGSFVSNDKLLNRIWYAGAYTTQLCTIPANRGNSLITLGPLYGQGYPVQGEWALNYTITNGSAAVVDGGKRDRLVWPGDFVISLLSIFASTNNLGPVRNSLESLLVLQDSTTGLLPYAGAPFNRLGSFLPGGDVSFTYNMHTLISMYNYYIFTGDLDWMRERWTAFEAGLEFCLRHVDDTGLLNVTTTVDWLRVGMGAHNIEANAILYQTLTYAIELAELLGQPSPAQRYSTIATTLRDAANTRLWDADAGLFRDNETTTLHPQDGNAWAVRANLTNTPARARTISRNLQKRWTPFGAPAPEVGGAVSTISPFATSFELQAHMLAGAPQTALDLMRLQWGFMLDDPRMTNSTLIEGYSSDGALHYTPYAFDARISHAHGWSTGPTWILTFYVAGLRITGGGGASWVVEPQPGDLEEVSASFITPRGRFAIDYTAKAGRITALTLVTPSGTSGEVKLPGVNGVLEGNGRTVHLNQNRTRLSGGTYRLRCTR